MYSLTITEADGVDSMATQQTSYCIALQPICDAGMRHVADELLYRNTPDAKGAQFDCELTATARVCHTAFYEIGLESLVGEDRKLFFNAPRNWLLNPDLLPPPSPNVVIEVLESVEGDREIMHALTIIKERGYTIALDDFVLNDRTRSLLDLADIIKIDLLADIDAAQLEEYHSRELQLLAEKVEDQATYEKCRELGFSLFQGYFYARPELEKRSLKKQRSSNQTAQLQIISALQNGDPDYDALERLLAQDPEICVALLRLTNSAAYRRQDEITSIRQALSLLGIERLRGLVMTLMLSRNGPSSRLLLPQMLTRAMMCESLAESTGRIDPHAAFSVGIFSMLDRFMDEDIHELLSSVPLQADIKNAVLKREGELGKVLKLVIAHEQARLKSSSQELVEKVNHSYLHGRAWANTVMRDVAA